MNIAAEILRREVQKQIDKASPQQPVWTPKSGWATAEQARKEKAHVDLRTCQYR